uniref:Mechanosensitive ion channel MscS domain-containing protein n=1 Tax=Corethron hystrix TaxID=216773 RepID=A0A6U5LXY5_9STRA|mmetsp:Transcript_7581/g.16444  ORF Transcript_7581/g.16444 Transcript_7581/m.16444 type:complete len:407 (+) Transcript_7581:230-1450(+)
MFRETIALLNDSNPFSASFGPANTRDDCVASSERLYRRLLAKYSPGDSLPFDVVASAARDKDGATDPAAVRQLLKIFRPDKEGHLALLEFAQSVDSVYKRLRLLEASAKNSCHLEKVLHQSLSFLFYILFVLFGLQFAGFDLMRTIALIGGASLAVSFAFSGAVANIFEGILMVAIRRPYNLGDRIAISQTADTEASSDGSSTWFVEDITLFYTKIRYATTNEVATVSNGAISNSRIINANRSPHAMIRVFMKWSLNVPKEKVEIFHATVEKFVQDRPRRFQSFSAFRVSRVEPDLGFVEYFIGAVSRFSWQNVGPIVESKAELYTFCLHLAQKLEMHYVSPPLPVQLGIEEMNQTNDSKILQLGDEVINDDSLMKKGGNLRNLALTIASQIQANDQTSHNSKKTK